MLSRRSFVRLGVGTGAALVTGGGFIPGALASGSGTSLSAEDAMTLLKAGNAAYVAGRSPHYPFDDTRRRAIAGSQAPFAAIIACSDSRCGPEQIFERGLGELFVIRNAGNTMANPQAMGSLEYAVSQLGVPLIVVLGHVHCGAVKAAVDVAAGRQLPGSLGPMVAPIVPAVHAAQPLGGDVAERAVVENVKLVTAELRSPRQPILFPPQAQGRVRVVSALYSLETGVVDFFDEGALACNDPQHNHGRAMAQPLPTAAPHAAAVRPTPHGSVSATH